MSNSGGIAERGTAEDKGKLQPEGQQTNIKETIESILVAFILAFIFRAFVVEAFVIPTGSMAPTLLGAHMRFRCPDCGYTFDVNYSSETEADSEDMRLPADAAPRSDIYCPNCGRLVATAPRPGMGGFGGSPGTPVPVKYGDRILVLKYIYLLHPPRRWDVVVFKSPDEPDKTHYQQNFIKRLVGLPGEKLMVLDGNIYIWNKMDTKWEIPPKPRSAQEALWRVVYDNDYYPHEENRPPPLFAQPWKSDGAGWDLSKGRMFAFDNEQGRGTLRFDPTANSTTQTLTDYLVYDSQPGMTRRPDVRGSMDDANAAAVSDMKLTAFYSRLSGNGALRLELSRSADVDHQFTAEITPDQVRLIHRTSTGEMEIWHKTLAEAGVAGDKPIAIEFQNVDYRVSLRLNGHDVFDKPMEYEPNVTWLIAQYRDGLRTSRPGEAEIEAENQKSTLEHVSLWRDVYYTNRGQSLRTGTPNNPVQLGPGEYFVMGDNSAISKDARFWDAPIDLPHEGLDDVPEGRVPEQFMLGKAVFVYWPAGYRLADWIPVSLIPNFGDMRWIH